MKKYCWNVLCKIDKRQQWWQIDSCSKSNIQITQVVGVDFNSLYPGVLSSDPHKFVRYSYDKTYIPGRVIVWTTDNAKIIEMFNSS